MHLSKPKTPINFSFHNIPGNNFREKMKFGKFFSYPLCAILIILGIVLLCFVPLNWEARLPILLLLIFIPTFIWCFKNYYDNYIYEELEPGVYRAVLKGKGIGKLSKEEKLSLLQKVFENKEEVENQGQSPKKYNAHFYAEIISLVLIGCLMYWAPITRKLICTHVNGTVYNCDLHQKAVLRNLDTVNLGAITGVVVANKYDKHDHETSYQIQFRTVNNTNVSYTEWWLTSLSFMLDRKVNALNKRFSKGEDFSYYLVNYVVVLGIIVLLFYPLIIWVMERKRENEVDGNYFLSPGQYRAILRAEGLDSFHSMQFGNVVMEVTDKKDVNYLKDDKFIGVQKEILKQDLQRYKEPVTFASLSENTSNERAKYIKIVSYFVALMIIIIFFSSAYTKIFGRTFSCTYKGNESYDCVVKVSDGKDFERYEGIVSAVMDYSEDGDRVGYKDINGKVFYEPQFNFSFMNNTKKMEKDVKALNAKFSKNENFVYNFKNNRHLPFGFILFICIPFIIFFMLYYYLSNYINKKVSLAQYNAVLKENGIGKLDRVKQQAPMQVYDNSWSGKYQAQMDKDVEDLTKQFYDDGK